MHVHEQFDQNRMIVNVTASLVVRYFVCSSCDRRGLKEWCVIPYKVIAVLSMSQSCLLHLRQTNHKVTSCDPKLLSLYNKNIGIQLAVHTQFDWSV